MCQSADRTDTAMFEKRTPSFEHLDQLEKAIKKENARKEKVMRNARKKLSGKENDPVPQQLC